MAMAAGRPVDGVGAASTVMVSVFLFQWPLLHPAMVTYIRTKDSPFTPHKHTSITTATEMGPGTRRQTTHCDGKFVWRVRMFVTRFRPERHRTVSYAHPPDPRLPLLPTHDRICQIYVRYGWLAARGSLAATRRVASRVIVSCVGFYCVLVGGYSTV